MFSQQLHHSAAPRVHLWLRPAAWRAGSPTAKTRAVTMEKEKSLSSVVIHSGSSFQRAMVLSLLTCGVWKKKTHFILCKADVCLEVLLFDLPQGEHLISHMPSCLPGVCLWLALAVLQTLHSYYSRKCSPKWSCSSWRHWLFYQGISKEERRKKSQTFHHELRGCAAFFSYLPQAQFWGSQDHTCLLPQSTQP